MPSFKDRAELPGKPNGPGTGKLLNPLHAFDDHFSDVAILLPDQLLGGIRDEQVDTDRLPAVQNNPTWGWSA